jgi:hypothetical protein
MGLKGGDAVANVPQAFVAGEPGGKTPVAGGSTGELVYAKGVRMAIDLYPEVASESAMSCETLCCICIDSTEDAKLRPYGAE